MTTKELAEWLENVVTVEKMGSTALHLTQGGREACKERADMFAAAARRLAVLEDEVETWRNREDIPCHELCDGCRPDACESCHWASKISAARAATDKERANG